jgi:hypothetical protein
MGRDNPACPASEAAPGPGPCCSWTQKNVRQKDKIPVHNFMSTSRKGKKKKKKKIN